MTIEGDNVALLKETYSQWTSQKGASFECWMNIIADDISLTSLADGAPEMAFTARRNGKAEILSYHEELARDWEMVFQEMDEFIAQGDRVVVIGRMAWRNRATGKVVETPKLDVWRLQDGKAVNFVEFYDTAATAAAATP
jgi:ketosteroid isomerase-like protein